MPDSPAVDFPPRPDLTGTRTYHLPFDLDAGSRGRFAVAVTLTLEELEPGEYPGRPAIGKPDFLAWLEGRGADNRLEVAKLLRRAQRMARAGRWKEFVEALQKSQLNGAS